jgi:hypothetical protein
MDAALIVITLVSLGLTTALLVYAARLQREDRERSEARVLALSEEIGRHREVLPHDAVRNTEDEVPENAGAHTSGPRIALDLQTAAAPVVASTLFDDHHESASSPHRAIVLVIAAVVVAVVSVSLYGLGGRVESTAVQAAPVVPPLELVGLQHTRKGDTLSVSGTVRNPHGAAERKGLTALVFVFDGRGAFVTSGRAPLDYQVLAPGDESPFVVDVPHAAGVARYRVSFRGAREVVPHVDRRDAELPAAERSTRR